jgi:hypothetical protein
MHVRGKDFGEPRAVAAFQRNHHFFMIRDRGRCVY